MAGIKVKVPSDQVPRTREVLDKLMGIPWVCTNESRPGYTVLDYEGGVLTLQLQKLLEAENIGTAFSYR